MTQTLRFVAQALLYVPFMALIGYFSTGPAYRHLDPGEALVRLSFSHAGARVSECRQRTPEELAKMPPNMRAPLDCPRERSPVTVELEMDGAIVYRIVAAPSGLSRDLASTVYWRRVVSAGAHRFTARLKDKREGDFNYVKEIAVTLDPGRVLVIDFNPGQGGFIFRL
jgi:hypothetical protein